ncbi:hypothetical protein [Octadecabacter sp. R77987]|uniref:hypothetical protein n=1 Tax=Octadecabacter sp. R77987 TaxID=3093874 RepID=UPI00366F781D
MTYQTKRVLLAALLIGLTGGCVGVVMEVVHATPSNHGEWLPGQGWLVPLVAFPGAALAGALCTWSFGRAGPAGWFWALGGAVLATILGGALGGTFLAVGIGTVLGAAAVVIYLVQFPLLLLLWLTLMACTHLVLQHYLPRLSTDRKQSISQVAP